MRKNKSKPLSELDRSDPNDMDCEEQIEKYYFEIKINVKPSKSTYLYYLPIISRNLMKISR